MGNCGYRHDRADERHRKPNGRSGTPETTASSTSWRRSARDLWKVSQTEAKVLKGYIDWQVANAKELVQPDEIKSRVDFD
jgi:hypothetical protein